MDYHMMRDGIFSMRSGSVCRRCRGSVSGSGDSFRLCMRLRRDVCLVVCRVVCAQVVCAMGFLVEDVSDRYKVFMG